MAMYGTCGSGPGAGELLPPQRILASSSWERHPCDRSTFEILSYKYLLFVSLGRILATPHNSRYRQVQVHTTPSTDIISVCHFSEATEKCIHFSG